MPHPAIQVSNLSKNYHKTQALINVSFSIQPGQIVGLLGPNGAGKTTLIRILAGILNADSGSAKINNIPINLFPQHTQQLLAYLPENNPLPLEARVSEYLLFRAKLKNIPTQDIPLRIEEALHLTDLARNHKNKLIGSLSKGLRQRVGIADCLLAHPPITIMDEPTIGLDPHQVLSIRHLISSLKSHTTLLISSHILHEAQISCDQFLILNQGALIDQGSLQQLQSKYIPHPTIHLSSSSPLDKITSSLLSIDPSISISSSSSSNNLSSLSFSTSLPLPSLSHKLLSLNTPITSLYQDQPSLEAIFLSATKPHHSFTSPKNLHPNNNSSSL